MGNDLASGHLDSLFGSQAPMVEQAHAVMFEGEAYVYWRVPGLEARTHSNPRESALASYPVTQR